MAKKLCQQPIADLGDKERGIFTGKIWSGSARCFKCEKSARLHRSKPDKAMVTAIQITRQKAPDRRHKAPNATPGVEQMDSRF